MIYGKDLETEEGMKILNLYADAMYSLFNKNIHIDVDNYDSPILQDIVAGSNLVVVQDTTDNREYFRPSIYLPDDQVFEMQDNMGIEIDMVVSSVSTPGDGKMYITMDGNFNRSYSTDEYAVFRRHGTYFYDSRVDNVEYGMVQKGSAYIRAARLNWFGKKVQEYQFPQKSQRVDYFTEIETSSASSSSSSSSSSSA